MNIKWGNDERESHKDQCKFIIPQNWHNMNSINKEKEEKEMWKK